MRFQGISVIVIALTLTACSTVPKPKPIPTGSLEKFEKHAEKFNEVVTMPAFEMTPEAVMATASNTIALGNAYLDRIGQVKPGEANFTNTIVALDDMGYEVGLAGSRLGLIEQTSTNAAMRDAATEAGKMLSEWGVGTDYREDVYAAVMAYAATNPQLSGEDKKLLDDTVRDYRRAGLNLPKAQRDEVEKLRKQLTILETDFQNNVTKATKSLTFTKAELEGVPEEFLEQKGIKTGPDEYTVKANVTFHAVMIGENAKSGDTRKKFSIARRNLAREQNIPLLQQILVLRDEIAHKLGYANYADYVTETRMVKNAATAITFEENLKTGLQPKFDAELAEYRQLKIKDTGDTNAVIHAMGSGLLRQPVKEDEIQRGRRAIAGLFPDGSRARRSVRHLPAHLRAEI